MNIKQILLILMTACIPLKAEQPTRYKKIALRVAYCTVGTIVTAAAGAFAWGCLGAYGGSLYGMASAVRTAIYSGVPAGKTFWSHVGQQFQGASRNGFKVGSALGAVFGAYMGLKAGWETDL